MELCDHLSAPLFWILARRSSEKTPPRPCKQDSSLFWDIVPMPMETGHFPVAQLVLQPPHELGASYDQLDEDMIKLHRGSHPLTFTYHKIAWEMLIRFDGVKTLREIGIEAAKHEGVLFQDVADSLEIILKDLIDVLALGTPDFTQCHRCHLKSVPHS